MKVGLRLPQTGEHNATKENIIHLSKEASLRVDMVSMLQVAVDPVVMVSYFKNESSVEIHFL